MGIHIHCCQGCELIKPVWKRDRPYLEMLIISSFQSVYMEEFLHMYMERHLGEYS